MAAYGYVDETQGPNQQQDQQDPNAPYQKQKPRSGTQPVAPPVSYAPQPAQPSTTGQAPTSTYPTQGQTPFPQGYPTTGTLTIPTSTAAPQPTLAAPGAPSGLAQGQGVKGQTPNLQATAPPASYQAPPPPAGVAQKISDYISSHNLKADQSNPQALLDIVQYLKTQGVNAQVDYTDVNGHTGGILIDGHPYQLINGSNGWTPLQAWQEGGGGGGGGAGTGFGGAGVGGGASFTGTNPQDPAVHDAIMRLLARGETPLSPNDPTLQSEFAPTSQALERAAGQTRYQSAERLAQEGGNSGGAGGAIDAEVNSINQNLGQQKGQAMAQLTSQELTARRQDVANALNFAQGEERNQLQWQLAQIDAALRQQQIGNQQQQFYDTLGYNIGRDNAQYDYLYNTLAAGGGG